MGNFHHQNLCENSVGIIRDMCDRGKDKVGKKVENFVNLNLQSEILFFFARSGLAK